MERDEISFFCERLFLYLPFFEGRGSIIGTNKNKKRDFYFALLGFHKRRKKKKKKIFKKFMLDERET